MCSHALAFALESIHYWHQLLKSCRIWLAYCSITSMNPDTALTVYSQFGDLASEDTKVRYSVQSCQMSKHD